MKKSNTITSSIVRALSLLGTVTAFTLLGQSTAYAQTVTTTKWYVNPQQYCAPLEKKITEICSDSAENGYQCAPDWDGTSFAPDFPGTFPSNYTLVKRSTRPTANTPGVDNYFACEPRWYSDSPTGAASYHYAQISDITIDIASGKGFIDLDILGTSDEAASTGFGGYLWNPPTDPLGLIGWLNCFLNNCTTPSAITTEVFLGGGATFDLCGFATANVTCDQNNTHYLVSGSGGRGGSTRFTVPDTPGTYTITLSGCHEYEGCRSSVLTYTVVNNNPLKVEIKFSFKKMWETMRSFFL